MTTLQACIDEARDHLNTGQPDRVNVLATSIDNSPATVSVSFQHAVEGVAPGTRISIGLENMHVVGVSGTTATVIRAFNGTDISAHTAGDLIRINPQFPDSRIKKFINRCIEGLPGDGLYRILDTEFTYTPSVSGYGITAPNLLNVWRVRYDYPGPQRDWPLLAPQDYLVDENPNETDFPSGVQIVLRQGGYPGRKVRVSYKASFNTLSALTDTLETTAGLHNSAHEIPAMGAALRCLYGRDIKRSFLNRQPEPRRQEEVPPGAASQAMRPLLQAYYDAVDREIRYLERKYQTQM